MVIYYKFYLGISRQKELQSCYVLTPKYWLVKKNWLKIVTGSYFLLQKYEQQ